MEKEKIEVVNQDAKIPLRKCCPFINGTYLLPVKNALGQQQIAKQTDVNMCIGEKCNFYDSTKQECLIKTYLLKVTYIN